MKNSVITPEMDLRYCIIYPRNRGDGYCMTKDGQKTVYRHRIEYEVMFGPVPEGLVLDHLCRNRSCINPLHLKPATYAENNARKAYKFIKHCANSRKTNCKNGHPYSGENLYVKPSGGRECRICMTDNHRAYYTANTEKCRAIDRAYRLRKKLKESAS